MTIYSFMGMPLCLSPIIREYVLKFYEHASSFCGKLYRFSTKRTVSSFCPDVSHLKFGYQDFSEKSLGRIGTKNIAMIKKLWLPGDPPVYLDSGSKPRRKTLMFLGR
jgi:hypothetical protein